MVKKKSWWKKNCERVLIPTCLVLSTALWFTAQHKPSSQEIRALQHNNTMTAYCYSIQEFNEQTALGHKPIVGLTVAVSPDRADLLGKTVYIKALPFTNIGMRKVTDLMATHNKNSIDILVKDKATAREFGNKKVQVYVIDD